MYAIMYAIPRYVYCKCCDGCSLYTLYTSLIVNKEYNVHVHLCTYIYVHTHAHTHTHTHTLSYYQ